MEVQIQSTAVLVGIVCGILIFIRINEDSGSVPVWYKAITTIPFLLSIIAFIITTLVRIWR